MEKFLVSSPAQLSQPFEMNSDSFIHYNSMDILDPNAASIIMDTNYLQAHVNLPMLSPQNPDPSYGSFSFQPLNMNPVPDSSGVSSGVQDQKLEIPFDHIPPNDGHDNDNDESDMVPKSDNSTLLHSSELMGPNQSLLNTASRFSHSRNVSLDDGYYNPSFLQGSSSSFSRPPSLHQSMHSTYRHHKPTLSTSSVASVSQDPPTYFDQYGQQYPMNQMSLLLQMQNTTLNPQQSPSSHSMDSMHPLSSSVSFQSFLESPQSFVKQPSQNQMLNTPRRHSRNKSLSISYNTPLRIPQQQASQLQSQNNLSQAGMSPVNLMGSQRVAKTPYLAKGKGHARSRSRMSIDASSAFLHSLSSQTQPSLPPSQQYNAPGPGSANNPFFNNSPIVSPGSQSNLDISSTATTPQHQPPSSSQRMQQANMNLGQPEGALYRGSSSTLSSSNIQGSYFTTPPSTSAHLPYNPHIHQQPTNLLLSGFSGGASGKPTESPTIEANAPGSAQSGVGNAGTSSTIIDAINIEEQDNDAFKQLKKAKSQSQISPVGRFLQPPPPPPKFMSDAGTPSTSPTRYMLNVPEQTASGVYYYDSPAGVNQDPRPAYGKMYSDMVGGRSVSGGVNGSLLPGIDPIGDKYAEEDTMESGLLSYTQHSASSLRSAIPEEMAAALGEDKVKEINTLVGNEINLQSLKLPVKKNKKEKPFDPKKKHACPLCDAKFQRPEHVKRHMKSHSSDKPFQCEELNCGKRFNRKDNLKAHLKKIHQKVNP